MTKERIETVVNQLSKTESETKAAIWLMDLIPDRPENDKLLKKLKKAQGLINNVKVRLNRLL